MVIEIKSASLLPIDVLTLSTANVTVVTAVSLPSVNLSTNFSYFAPICCISGYMVICISG